MSGASNLGYSNITPLSNGNYINGTNSHNPAFFTSTQIPGLPGLAGSKNNIDAAAGKVPGICTFSGGAKRKNISKIYKMKRKTSRKIKSIKRKSAKKRGHSSRTRRRLRGGYGQYQNNAPISATYSIGGILSSDELGLANPPPYNILGGKKKQKGGVNANCVDNYNHFTNKGFPSKNW